jgi:biopolymer transport protein ExbD
MQRIFFLLTIILFAACGHRSNSRQHSALEDSTGVRDEDRLVCIVKGYDSIIYYHGSSRHMQDIKRGLLTDTVFTKAMFSTVKKEGYLLTIKPGDGGNVLPNFKEMINLANDYDATARTVQVIDDNETRAFGVMTPDVMANAINAKSEPLQLPKDDGASDDSIPAKYPKTSQWIVLVAGDEGMFVYQRDNLQQGKKYTYDRVKEFLKTKSKEKDFYVVLRPSAKCSYKNTVDALDILKMSGIEHYGLFDIKKEEEDYLREIYR